MNKNEVNPLINYLSLMLWIGGTMVGFSQQKVVSGNVTDENGLPLPGATIIEQGTTNDTTTDFDGNYSLEVSDSATLEVSYVGYSTQTSNVEGSIEQDFQLLPGGQLDEIVVTALGISREKKSLGYAVQTVDGESLEDVKSVNPIEALQGEVAGLDVQSFNTMGGSANVVIRGYSSLSGLLYQIDIVTFVAFL